MSVMLPANSVFMPAVISELATSKSARRGWNSNAVLRAPTDPYFYADVILENIAVGSRYWLVQDSDHSNVLATGVASDTTVTLTDIPAYSNPMLILVRVRKATSTPLYKPLDTYANLIKAGVTVYISQEEDV